MSAIPMSMAMLQNHAKNMMCQKLNLATPCAGTPVQMRSLATRQKPPTDVTPSLGSTATAAATNTMNIHGDATWPAAAIFWNPRIASAVTAIPTRNTTSTQPTELGYTSFSFGIVIPNGRPTAVAATEIMLRSEEHTSELQSPFL